jgi:CRISPR-associated protein Cmr4
MHSRIYYLHALSALHAGTGQGAGVIDLPIAREKSTHLPVVPGSSLKGVLREELEGQIDPPEHRALFGPKTENASEHAGALAFGDARLLCLPVRSLAGTFAWVTCPLVLRRYLRDLVAANRDLSPPTVPTIAEADAEVCSVTDPQITDAQDRIFLEDLNLKGVPSGDAQDWAELIGQAVFADTEWRELFQQRFAIVSDAVFDFLAETATEIVTRIRLQEGTRTVAEGGLWFEEHLPAESLLWGIAACDRSRYDKLNKPGDELLANLPDEERLQIGGKASVGKGQVRWVLAGHSASEARP